MAFPDVRVGFMDLKKKLWFSTSILTDSTDSYACIYIYMYVYMYITLSHTQFLLLFNF